MTIRIINAVKREKMEKRERLKAAYDYLRNQGRVHTQSDVASLMDATRQNVSAAMKGKDGVLTNSFLKRFNAAFDDVFNSDWLINGEGEMLARSPYQEINGDHNTQIAGNGNSVNGIASINKALDEIAAQRQVVQKSQEQIDRLLSIIENMNSKQ